MMKKIKTANGVIVDGVFGASQFNLQTVRKPTSDERLMIDYALRLPGSGLVYTHVFASRVIITSAVESEYRERHVKLYQKAIGSVLSGGWLYELESQFPAVKVVGLTWSQLTPDEQYAVEAQYRDEYPFMENIESLRWWRADPSNAALLSGIREILKEWEERRRPHVYGTEVKHEA